MQGNNRTGAYYSSGKRGRDSLEASSSRSLQPFLLGQGTPKRNRVSFGGGGSGSGSGVGDSTEWSSLLSFNTPMRPSRLSNLRRRETFSGIGASGLCGSAGFVLRDKSERQSVARALQILDSRKRLRELSQNEQGPPPSPSPNSSSTAGGFLGGGGNGGGSEVDVASAGGRRNSFNRKRRRLTINGTLDAMRQEDMFASTSLRDIARQAGPSEGPSLQKRIFTTGSSVPAESSEPAAPSSKRLRAGATGEEVGGAGAVVNGGLGDSSSEGSYRSSRRSLCGSLSSRLAERSAARESDVGRPASGSSGSAAQRRLLSYLSPAQVEARYARRSAAGELARRHSCSVNSGATGGSGNSRRVGSILSSRPSSAVTTQAAQTDLSCNRTEVLQKSPVKDGEKEDSSVGEKEERLRAGRHRHGPLSVADFVANLDRARGQRSGDSDVGSECSAGPLGAGSVASDVQRRMEADSEARRNRLDRLRKLLSDVTREPPMPTINTK